MPLFFIAHCCCCCSSSCNNKILTPGRARDRIDGDGFEKWIDDDMYNENGQKNELVTYKRGATR